MIYQECVPSRIFLVLLRYYHTHVYIIGNMFDDKKSIEEQKVIEICRTVNDRSDLGAKTQYNLNLSHAKYDTKYDNYVSS